MLAKCFPDKLIEHKIGSEHFLKDPIQAGFIYPTVYVDRPTFYAVQKPENSHHFVILRDLRDITVSAYYSLKISHPEMQGVSEFRPLLNSLAKEEALMWTIETWLQGNAGILSSWVESGEPWIRYEDLLENEVEILQQTLINQCGLPIAPKDLEEKILRVRFKQITGRERGKEDVRNHFRKGIAGDWKNHFTPRIKERFKDLYGEKLIRAGYEKNNDW